MLQSLGKVLKDKTICVIMCIYYISNSKHIAVLGDKKRRIKHMISYEKLINLLKENDISQYKLRQEKILGSATITKIFKNNGINGESIDIKVVDKMCKLLNCQPGDILECVNDIEGYTDKSERRYRE